MNFIETEIPDLIIIEPKVFKDDRGYFFESFNQQEFEKHIGKIDFVQDNESKSTFGVLRGLHFQRPPFTQAKLVRCILGSILDVVVDLRADSPTYGRHLTIELSSEDKKQLFIPKGFAHGFVVLSPEAVFAYKVDNYYSPSHDSGIFWNDPQLGIDWRIDPGDIILSEKDKKLNPLAETEIPFFP
jgi:dTDP-4-dehydrorhamnose 3,5-epimerase